MGFNQIMPLEGKEYESDSILRDQFKVFFTSCEDMEEIPDNSIHLVFTSPPYYDMRSTVGYNRYKDFLKVMYSIFKEMYDKLKPGRPMLINISDYQTTQDKSEVNENVNVEDMGRKFDIPSHFSYLMWKLNKHHAKRHELLYEDTITWSKPGSTSQRAGTFIDSGFPLKYRPNQVNERNLVFRKGEIDYKNVWKEARRSGRYDDMDISTYKKFQDELSIDYENVREYLNDLWEIAPETQSEHPAPFSQELAEVAIKLYSLKRETVLDPFLGSATTIERSMALDRKSVGYENLSAESDDTPDFVDMIKNRTGANNQTLDDF